MKNVSGRFVKAERLSSKNIIQEIFDKGSVIYAHPLKVYYMINDSPYNRVLITVPKRNHKKAVDRNLIKRRIRETYRLNKGLISNKDTFVDIIVVYIGTEILEFKQISNKINNVLAKIKKSILAGNIPAVPAAD